MTAQSACAFVALLLGIAGIPAQGSGVPEDVPASSQSLAPPATRNLQQVVADYIQLGLEGNLALQSQEISYQKSLAALAEARGAYLPALSLEGRYTRADGGRKFDIPIGSIVNPLYSTLNQLTQNLPNPTQFAPLADQQFDIQRQREQQTALKLTQPLYAPKISANVRAQRAGADSAGYSRDAFKAALIRDIGVAYLDWCKAQQSLVIIEANLQTLAENVRISGRLFDAGKVTEDQVLRARAEMLAVEQQRLGARNGIQRAQRYFNFLLNRGHDEPIEAAALPRVDTLAPIPLETLLEQSMTRRAELKQLASQQSAADAGIDAARADYKPTLALALEGGTQGETYRFGRDDRYALGSLVFSWSLFSGNQTRARVNQAKWAAKASAVQIEQTRRQIGLQVEQAREDLLEALSALRTAQAREEVARAAFKIASRKRDAGVIPQVEFLDSRSSLADAQSNLNLVRFDVFARAVELDFAAGTPASHLESP
jgi:outer membrane protein